MCVRSLHLELSVLSESVSMMRTRRGIVCALSSPHGSHPASMEDAAMRRIVTWIVIALAMLSSPTHAVVTHNRLATNRLATNRLATNRLATNRLATNALTSGALTADPSADELLSTPEGRDLYSYVV